MSERERRLVMIGGAAAAVLLLFGVLVPLDSNVSKTHTRVVNKQKDLTWMKGVAPELQAAGPPPSANGESLLVIVDRSARESGLGSSLVGSEPDAKGVQLSLRLDKAPFDALIAWLARLNQVNGIRVDSANIDNAGVPGLVNAAIVLKTS